MTSSIPTRGDIRNRFLIMYGTYLSLILIIWMFVKISFVYVFPMVAILCIVGYVNYRNNVKVLSRRPLVSSDDFGEYVGVSISDIKDDGLVRIRGEIWKARSESPIEEGREVEVVRLLEGMTLLVQERSGPSNLSTEDLI
ncbi:MAG TPA: NfeD family protein [Candidatus Methanofastidiosa archaeon]|nr:NfeD family protein [Candidatus Methanofastidiosa archaeon]HPR41700.1 NfeD family protein [Candidatus Methanofastidiosa archaeon]